MPLDARLPDDLARLGAAVARVLQLRRPDLAEQAEELAAERALRVRALRQRADVQPGKSRACSSR